MHRFPLGAEISQPDSVTRSGPNDAITLLSLTKLEGSYALLLRLREREYMLKS